MVYYLGGFPPIVMIWYLNGTLPIKQPRGLLIQGWHYMQSEKHVKTWESESTWTAKHGLWFSPHTLPKQSQFSEKMLRLLRLERSIVEARDIYDFAHFFKLLMASLDQKKQTFQLKNDGGTKFESHPHLPEYKLGCSSVHPCSSGWSCPVAESCSICSLDKIGFFML